MQGSEQAKLAADIWGVLQMSIAALDCPPSATPGMSSAQPSTLLSTTQEIGSDYYATGAIITESCRILEAIVVTARRRYLAS